MEWRHVVQGSLVATFVFIDSLHNCWNTQFSVLYPRSMNRISESYIHKQHSLHSNLSKIMFSELVRVSEIWVEEVELSMRDGWGSLHHLRAAPVCCSDPGGGRGGWCWSRVVMTSSTSFITTQMKPSQNWKAASTWNIVWASVQTLFWRQTRNLNR